MTSMRHQSILVDYGLVLLKTSLHGLLYFVTPSYFKFLYLDLTVLTLEASSYNDKSRGNSYSALQIIHEQMGVQNCKKKHSLATTAMEKDNQ